MRIEQLKYFLQVVKDGSILKASETLFIAQPSLSANIKMFEEELGYKLFNRSKEGCSLTKKGEMILPIVENILSEMEYLYSLNPSINSFDKTDIELSLQIAVVASLKKSIRDALFDLLKIYPKISINLSFENTTRILDKIKNNQYDLGIINLPQADQQKYGENIEFHYLFSRRIFFIVHKSSPLAAQKSISLSVAAKQKFSLFSDGENFNFVNYLFGENIRQNIIFTSTDFLLTLDYIKNFGCIGLYLMPFKKTSLEIVPEEYVLIPLEEAIYIKFYSCYNRENISPQKQAIINELIGHFEV